MTDEELRARVREVIAQRLPRLAGTEMPSRHPSHAMFVLAVGKDEDGPCIIEPAVACTHCGYCKSYGH